MEKNKENKGRNSNKSSLTKTGSESNIKGIKQAKQPKLKIQSGHPCPIDPLSPSRYHNLDKGF